MSAPLEKARLWVFTKVMGLSRRGLLRFIPDAPFLKMQYYLKLGERLNLKEPKLYNEKLQWLKLYDRQMRYHQLVDKIAVRDYVAPIIGDIYLVPVLQTCDAVEDVNWDALPSRFVIKCAHGSSSNIICRDKAALDIEEAKEKLRYWMKKDLFNLSREWPYKGVKPRILIEEFLESDTGDVPYDYKIMCFSGVPKYIIVDVDRYTNHTRNYYDTNWVKQDVFNRHPNYEGDVPRPKKLNEMLDIAHKLSQGFPHIRVDLYAIGDKVYFGEMTFFHGYGMEVFRPRSFEQMLGDLIHLPEKTTERG